jgi:peptide methionine sulfoxide reductase MsrB
MGNINGNLKTAKVAIPCRCGSSQGHIFPSGNHYHSGKIHCAKCGKFLKWISKAEFDRASLMDLVN